MSHHGFRNLTDAQLNTWSVEDLYKLASECDEEPADETVCDACAAYMLGQDKEQVLNEAKRHLAYVLPFDWTAVDGRTNCSPTFLHLVDEVERLIRGDAYQLIGGNINATARLIMAQLAHVHHLGPT